MSPDALHQSSPQELRERVAAERAGGAFLVFRDDDGAQRIHSLDEHALVVGRTEGADLRLASDSQVSRIHAKLERVGEQWTVVDDGLSRNGTFVNSERVHARRRLVDGDVLRFGSTDVTFRQPTPDDADGTSLADDRDEIHLSPAQRRVLVALCRPYKDGRAFATPATNQEVAAELFLSVDAVKTHLRALFAAFGIGELAQNQKRARLVELALERGVVNRREL